jgi:hypothetical protein
LADTTYIASYHSSSGGYAYNQGYFATAYDSSTLRALGDGEDGGNGVYKYGVSGFPTTTYQSSNYWVDVIYDNSPQTFSLWEQGTITGDPDVVDPSQVELGMKFRSDVDGSVTGIAFFKGATNTGPFLGHLWTLDGTTMLAEKSYSNNSSEGGWQVITFDTPVPISANTTYVVSYFTQSGNYAAAGNFFTSEVYNPPLHALASSDPDGPNGVYYYGIGGGFPTGSYNNGNYWVDVLFTPDVYLDTSPPVVVSTIPLDNQADVSITGNIQAKFSEGMDDATINGNNFELRDASNNLVPAAAVSYDAGTRTATIDPTSFLTNSTTYTATVIGGTGGVADLAGNEMAANYSWTFTTSDPPPLPPNDGPGGPILIISNASNPFTRYYTEILRAEGLNEFLSVDISSIDATLLADYQIAILGEMPLSAAQVTMLTDWVTAGGNLIAMRPDPQLASLLGLTATGGSLAEGYLLVDTATTPGNGIVGDTIQYHTTADLYTLNGATAIATLYSNASTATTNPAVTVVNVGSNGGQAAAFTYDLAKSVVYTRQGNPAWVDINGDGSSGPVRADDLFHNGTDPDWVDLNKVAIPQADEQQRLLANLILSMNLDNNPLPRFWYFPRGEKAVVLLTSDDHSSSNIPTRLDQYKALSPTGCSVDDWECVRSSMYIYPGTTLTEVDANNYTAEGFEIGVHIDTSCGNYTLSELENIYADQIGQFTARFPSLPLQDSERTHCIAWSGWSYQANVKEQKGIRLDTNYYFWPPEWANDQPGMFTGSGIPIRFADLDGTIFDVYQATTQMTDESGQTYPFTIDTLLDRALGPEGYYGVFTANMHSDSAISSGANAIITSAQANSVPIVSGRQLLTWLDGRNGSAFEALTWDTDTLTFSVSIASGANGLQVMLPVQSSVGPLSGISLDGSLVTYIQETIKGVEYAIFYAQAGTYVASYAEDTTPPIINAVSPADGATNVPVDTTVTGTFNEPMQATTVNAGTFELRAPGDVLVAATVTYNAASNTAVLTPDANLALDTTYTATVKGGVLGMTDAAGVPLGSDTTWSFTTSASLYNCPCNIFGDTPGGSQTVDIGAYELGVKFQSSVTGWITGVRFYKPVGTTGEHIGKLWDSAGNLLASAPYVETDSGWQEVIFSSPVPIIANTTYIASYSWPGGYYPYQANAFSSAGITNVPLTALQSGIDGPNGVYNGIPGQFPTDGNGANYFADVIFVTSLVDTTPPTIVNRTPAPGALDIDPGTNVVVSFSEPMDAATITDATFSLRADGEISVVPAVVSYLGTDATLDPVEPLLPDTLYHVAVSGYVTDLAGIPLGGDDTWNFTTANDSLSDTTSADFAAGSGACFVDEIIGDGALRLPLIIDETFSSTSLPDGWDSNSGAPWTGGSASVLGGQLVVDGAIAGTTSTYTPGRSLEFVATFTSDANQHIGFTDSIAFNGPWAIFSTKDTTTSLYARTTGTDTLIAGSYLNVPHLYRIEWTASSVMYYIDDVLVATHNTPISGPLAFVASDLTLNSSKILIDSLRLSPYLSPCTFESRVLDASALVDWLTLDWMGNLPAGTAVSFETRSGSTVTPDTGWSGWATVDTSGIVPSPYSQYIQYRATLSSTNATSTPIVEKVQIFYQAVNNTAPVANDDAYSKDEDTALTVPAPGVLANDTDAESDPLSAILDTGPSNGSLTLNADGSFTYTPNLNYNGTDSFTYTTADVNDGTDLATVTITVNAVNDAPVANDDNATTDEDTGVTINVLANDTDVDGDTLTVDSVTQATHGSVTSNGSVTYTPSADYCGADSFTYTASDGNGGTDTATVTIDVTCVNDAPVANDDSATTDEDTGVTINVLANDTDVDGDALTVSSVTQPTNGTAVINADNTVTYTPNANFNGGDSFTYTISDGNGGSDTATVRITINPVNDAPVAVNDSTSRDEDTPVSIDVLANDNDVDGDSLTVSSVSALSNGSAVIETDGTITYTPDANFCGNDSFTYMISDGNGGSDTATVTVDVTCVNDPPVANDDSASTDEDTAVTIDVLANDTDVDGDTLTVNSLSNPANGTAVVNADHTVTYSPDADFNGSDSFTYTASDGKGGTDTATVIITVNAVNDPPLAADDSVTTEEDTPVNIAVLTNDSDVDGDNLAVSSVSTPMNGTAVIETDGTITYTPAANFNGSDSFTYSISDGNGGTDTATVFITVTPVNDPPEAFDDSESTDEDTPVNIAVLANDTDVDSDTLSVESLTQPSNGSVTNNGADVTYTPDADFNGSDSFTYTISDGNGGTDSATVIITVNPVNDPPSVTANSEKVSVNEGQIANNSGVYADVDDGDTIVLSVSVGTITDNRDGTWDWSFDSTDGPDESQTVIITATDSDGAVSTTTFGLVVNNVIPSITLSGFPYANLGVPYTLNLSAVTDPGDDNISECTVDWGDGSTSDCVTAIEGSLMHTYAGGPDDYTIFVDLVDEDGTYDEVDLLALTVLPTSQVINGGCTFDRDPETAEREFRLLFTPDVQDYPAFKLTASNPGQVNYNVFSTGNGQTATIEVTIPYPFVTQGNTPAQAYSGVTASTSQLGEDCFTPLGDPQILPAEITLDSYATGSMPGSFGDTVTLTFNELPVDPVTGLVYLNLQLDYGLKDLEVDANGDGTPDRYDQKGRLVNGVTYYDAVNFAEPTETLIADHFAYLFSSMNDLDGGVTIVNQNEFKVTPGVAGFVFQLNDDGNLEVYTEGDLTVRLVIPRSVKDPRDYLEATPDEDGWYMIEYKHTGKPTNYRFEVYRGDELLIEKTVRLKGNEYEEVHIYLDSGAGGGEEPPPPPPPTTAYNYVSELLASSKVTKKNWNVMVTVTISDQDGNLVSNAAVSGIWTVGDVEQLAYCETDETGTCEITVSKIDISITSVDFNVTNVFVQESIYDPDAEGSVTQITIQQ